MILESAGKGLEKLVHFYNNSPRARAVANSVGLYTSINLAGECLSAIQYDGGALLSDVAAPIVSAMYLNEQVNRNDITNGTVRDASKIGIAALVGGLFTNFLTDEKIHSHILIQMQDTFDRAYCFIANNITDIHSPYATAMGISAGIATILRIHHYYSIARDSSH